MLSLCADCRCVDFKSYAHNNYCAQIFIMIHCLNIEVLSDDLKVWGGHVLGFFGRSTSGSGCQLTLCKLAQLVCDPVPYPGADYCPQISGVYSTWRTWRWIRVFNHSPVITRTVGGWVGWSSDLEVSTSQRAAADGSNCYHCCGSH